MTQTVARLLEEAGQLSVSERADLTDRLVETLTDSVPPDIEEAQLAELERRIAEVDSGSVKLVPDNEALEEVRRRVAAVRNGL